MSVVEDDVDRGSARSNALVTSLEKCMGTLLGISVAGCDVHVVDIEPRRIRTLPLILHGKLMLVRPKSCLAEEHDVEGVALDCTVPWRHCTVQERCVWTLCLGQSQRISRRRGMSVRD